MVETNNVGLSTSLSSLTEDVIIYAISFLEPPDIARLSLTCKRFDEISGQRIVWTNACHYHVVNKGYPVSQRPLSSLPVYELKTQTLSSFALAHRWIDGVSSPRRTSYISGTEGTSVSDVRFIPGHGGRLVLTISKSIWSVVSVWDLGREQRESNSALAEPSMRARWGPRGGIFSGFALNCEAESDATLAVSVHFEGSMSVKILLLDSAFNFREIFSVDTEMKPILLKGDILALADTVNQTAIWNWKEGTYAILRSDSTDDPAHAQYNDCLQVLFGHQSILVVRARSIHLFPWPELRLPAQPGLSISEPAVYEAIAHHSFGWLDGVSANICPFLESSTTPSTSWPPISILIRKDSDDPWAEDAHKLELYSILPNLEYRDVISNTNPSTATSTITAGNPPAEALSAPDSLPIHSPPLPSPYLFPPTLTSHIKTQRGSLRCPQLYLGRFGTAAWLEPPERSTLGLVTGLPPTSSLGVGVPLSWQEEDRGSMRRNECLKVAAFKGPLFAGYRPKADDAAALRLSLLGPDEISPKVVSVNESNDWTSFDYDEVGGRIALGSSFGKVKVLEI